MKNLINFCKKHELTCYITYDSIYDDMLLKFERPDSIAKQVVGYCMTIRMEDLNHWTEEMERHFLENIAHEMRLE